MCEDQLCSAARGANLDSWLLAAAPDGLWVFDHTGRTLFANDRMGVLLGRDREEMEGFDAFSAFDAPGQERLRARLRELETAGTPGDNLECSLLRRDGQRVAALISHTPIVDAMGRRHGWLHRISEYSDQQRLLEMLRRREQQLAEAEAIARVGSWEWDIVHDHLSWSDELFRIYGLDRDSFVPTYAGFLDGIHPADRDAVAETVGSVIPAGDSFEFEARILRAGGVVVWIRGQGIVHRDETGVAQRMSGTAQDVTEAKEAEPAVDPEVLDADRLEELLELDPGDPSLLLRFIGRFGSNARHTVAELRRTQAEGTAYELGRLAHGLKGTAANLGAHRLAARCSEVEGLGDDGVLASGEALDVVAVEVDIASRALEEFAAALQPAAPDRPASLPRPGR